MDKRATRLLASILLLAAVILLLLNEISPKEAAAPKDGYIEINEREYKQLQQEATQWKQKYDELKDEGNKKKQRNKQAVQSLHLNITEGMTSKEVSRQLEKAKVIKDADKFNEYLADHELQQLIQLGDYTLTNEMDFKTIANIITGK